MVYHDGLDDWTAWSEVKDSEYITSGGESGGGGGDLCTGTRPTAWIRPQDATLIAHCPTGLYYEGNDDEVPVDEVPGLVEAGTIEDDTLIYSDQAAFPFEGWTAWSECSYCFGIGEAPEGGGQCTSLYYEGNDDEVAVDDVPGLVEAGTIDDDTLVYSDQAAFPFEGWTAWSECSYCFGIGEAPEGGGGGGGGAKCSSLYYEGSDEEVPFAEVAALLEAGTITEDTLVYSDQDAFPFEGWTAWSECSDYFGESGGCTTLTYTNDGETTEEATAADLPGLVAAGTINDETMIYSTDDGFAYEGWTEYSECKSMFEGAGDAAEEGVPPEDAAAAPEAAADGENVDESEQAEKAMADKLSEDERLKAEAAAAKAAEEKAAADEEAARIAAEKKAKMDAKMAELEAAKAKAAEEKERKAKEAEEAAAEDAKKRDEAGLSPVATTITDDELLALADFDKWFGIPKAKYDTSPPFKQPMLRKKAKAAWEEAQKAENVRRERTWKETKAKNARKLKQNADSRIAMGQFIAEKGYEALLMGSQKILQSTSIMHGPLDETTGMGWNNRYCMVWPAVRVPNIPPGHKFFFFYKDKGASKPERVAFLKPGNFKCSKNKQKGRSALRFDAPLVMKGDKFGKQLKFIVGAKDAATRDKWIDAFTTTEIREDEASAAVAEKAADLVSHYDFDCTIKGKKANLQVTKESIKLFQKGQIKVSHAIKELKSWSVGSDKITFHLNAGGTVSIDTTEGQAIKDALVNQAKGIIQDKKDAKAKAEADAQAAEEAEMLRKEAEAEEALRWCTYEELKTGNYERYNAAGERQGAVDEKNKATQLLTDEDFEKVMGMTKEAFGKQPAFKKPMLLKKQGLGPFQFNE